MRIVCGYGAAIAVTPYLLIKIAWSFGLFIPTEQMGDTSWRMINASTAVLAAVGILLAMAFCRPWGERLPAWLVSLPVWVGTGLLVPMLLLAPVLGPAAMTLDKEAGAAEFWAYEQIFVMVSLVGIGICLPLALAGYAKARWPEALGGPTDYEELPGHTRQLQNTLARIVAAGCILLGIIKVFWAAGGTFGIVPDMLNDRDVWWHLLTLSTGVWAFVGAWGLLVLTSRRGSRRFLPPMAAAWISSGMLFSYNLFSAIRPDSQYSPEFPLARVLTTEVGIVLGVMMGMIILLVLHDRRRALRGES
ncbi:hypothetical protein MUG84_23850 [Paenibacillus sp. KQZ6P-2]|uniref:Uncharacterized protein n=1 Tax=Paenibacillus mangrovi TaxID=2931978 RepID=A0A9X1WYW9_9BACL|nr:hypothetical protein [Paenibacillus mangrovi]MCJ8014719.1 hypothetical protein [Paenibacillus mangrovi]